MHADSLEAEYIPQTWFVELDVEGYGFVAQAGGYESAVKAKAAAARAFKSERHLRRVRVVYDGKPTVIYEATFRPGSRAKWTPHPGNLAPKATKCLAFDTRAEKGVV